MRDSDLSKDIRLCFRKNQIMKQHKTKYPISVMCLKGKIEFSVQENIFILLEGDTIFLNGDIMHELNALEESVIRLNLIKG